MSKRRTQPITTSKEDTSFREALKLYESKQYKKSLKLVDAILKKNSNYADGYALKALLLYFMKEEIESEVYVEKALKKDPESPIVNHILGILRRNQLKYVDAATFFKKSLDNGSVNKQIWRDLAVMQVQNRDYKNLIHSRAQYLEEFLGYRANWTGLATAHHLNNDYPAAEKVLTKFEELAKGKLGENELFENSELELYKNRIIAEYDTERALRELDNLDTLDKLDEMELRAKYLMKLGRKQEASKVYRQLLKRNPDNIQYYILLEASLETLTKSPRFRDALYTKLAKFYPRSDPAKFLPLTFLSGEKFKERAQDYVISQLKRGVPATFVNVKTLYKDKEKAKIIGEIVLDFFPKSAAVSPVVWVWTAYFLAQHYLHLKQLEKAKEYIESAVEHTPTLVELYILKARVYKHLNQLEKASEIMNEGRLLDLQDRFINSKAGKYYFRANNIDEAVKVLSLFTKNDNASNGVKDLHMMQANWFIIESAEAYYRLHQEALEKYDVEDAERYLGLSLKRFNGVAKVFEEYYNDQVDFHSYCLRRGTARAYIEMIKWEDKVFTTPVYCRAVKGASAVYFQLHERLTKEGADAEAEILIKKRDKKARKEAAAKHKALEAEKNKVIAYADDDDVFGEKLVETKRPLEDFDRIYFKSLLEQGPERILTSDIQYQLQFRLKKIALAVSALSKLKKQTNNLYPLIPAFVLNLKYNTEKGISKVLAEKGIEKNFKIDFTDIDSFIESYTSRLDYDSILGLIAVLKLDLEVVNNDGLKKKILNATESLEPLEQSEILRLL